MLKVAVSFVSALVFLLINVLKCLKVLQCRQICKKTQASRDKVTTVQVAVSKSQAAQETAQQRARKRQEKDKIKTTKDQEEDLLYVYSYCADIKVE